ncbi:MAG: M48 family metalloprotease [Terracidiphilus sp.]
MARFARTLVFVLLLAGFLETTRAQQPNGCSLPEPPLTIHRANIFSDQQEQWLGDAQAEGIEPHYLLLPADKSEYLTKLGEKLLAQLPPTSIHYSFRIFESGEVRSFSLAGGHVYVSRKLILDARNEDELAGILAQEIGSIYIHHTATVYTRAMDKLLDVKSLGGQADVRDKYQRMLNIPRDILEYKWNPQLSIQDRENDELQAGRVGFYAMVKAGYAPQAFDSILDRASLNEGYKGNLITDALDLTTNTSMRVRMAEKMNKSLPSSCSNAPPQERLEFKAFQDFLIRQRVDPLLAPTAGLKTIKLDPPMSPALENVRLSPDANFLLAQDELKIHVLSRAPLKLLFSIDAPGAQMAQFTPDSADVVFYYSGLRFEDWKVATGQRVMVRDFADYAGCLQDSLSPNGYTFACFSRNYDRRLRFSGYGSYGWLKLSDLRTGKLLYENTDFYLPNFMAQAPEAATHAIYEPRQASVAWSQDGRYFLASSGTAAVGFDVKAGKTVGLGNALSHLYESRMAFVNSDKLAFECDWGFKENGPRDTFKMCYTTFPDGFPLSTFTAGRTWMAGVTRGLRLLTGPTSDAAATLFEPAKGLAGPSFKFDPVDLAGDTLAAEAERGGVSVGRLGGSMETLSLPVTPFPSLEAAHFSADGRFLAISDRARGAVWELNTGKQVSLGGPFRNAQFDEQDKLQARVAAHELKPALDARIDRRTGKVAPRLDIAAEEIQYGSVMVRYVPLEEDQELYFNIKIEAVDAASGVSLWSRRFPYNPPLLLDTDGDQLLLLMDRRSRSGGEELDHYRKLMVQTSDETKEFLESGVVVEVVSRRTGVPERVVVAPEKGFGRSDVRSAVLYGDLLAIYGSSNNTVVYRLTDGARLLAFSGSAIAGDAGMGLIAATNQPQQVIIYDVATGKEVKRVTLDNYAMAARFIPATRQLLVLTATQRVYALELPAVAPETGAAK